MTDVETVRIALKRARRLAGAFRYGGLSDLCKLIDKALVCLGNIEKHIISDLPLFSGEPIVTNLEERIT